MELADPVSETVKHLDISYNEIFCGKLHWPKSLYFWVIIWLNYANFLLDQSWSQKIDKGLTTRLLTKWAKNWAHVQKNSFN